MSFTIKRKPKALSYSSWSMYENNAEEFFLKYLAETRAPSLPQLQVMSVGSAADAYIKSALHSAIFGEGADENFSFHKLFTDQVEEQNRDWALVAGKYVFDCYVQSGAYQDLLELLLRSIEPPQFESKIDAIIADGVPFTGKPDLRFKLQFPSHEPVRVILDWKVKGFCSKHSTSPSVGYARCRDAYDAIKLGIGKTKAAPLGKQSASHNTEHDRYLAYSHRGLTINQAYMEACSVDYANQVSTYGWMLGEKPGDEDVVVWIDEITAKPAEPFPHLRVANHRARVSRDHQLTLLDKISACWGAIQSGHIFGDMSREDSDARCEVLENMSVGLQTDGTADENWFNEVTRPQSFHR